MKIQKLYLLFKNKQSYDEAVLREEIKPEHIVFLKDEGVIMTHGHMFGGGVEHAKGFFKSEDELPNGVDGDWAVVYVDDVWYIYVYRSLNLVSYFPNTTPVVQKKGWQRIGEYGFKNIDPVADMDDVYVRKDSLGEFLKDIYNNVYVRKDEVYTPDQWDSENGSDSTPDGSTRAMYAVIFEIDKTKFNPVASYVIYNALQDKADKSDLDTKANVSDLDNKADKSTLLRDYYTKQQIDDTTAKKADIYASEKESTTPITTQVDVAGYDPHIERSTQPAQSYATWLKVVEYIDAKIQNLDRP